MTRPARLGIEQWVGLGVSGVALLAYLVTLSPTVNFLDSGELITVGVTGGVAHPPGYPLYTLLDLLAAALPLGSAAVRVNAISALAGALAVGLFYALVYEILRHHLHISQGKAAPPRSSRAVAARTTPPRPPTRPPAARPKDRDESKATVPVAAAPRRAPPPDPWPLVPIAAAAGAALLLAASLTFWNWATQAKMYTIHFAFVAGLFWLTLRVRRAWRGAGAPGALWPPGAWSTATRWLLLLAFCTGLTFTNHYMSWLLLPGLAILLLWPGHPGAGEVAPRAQSDALPWRWLLRYAPWLVVAGLVPLLLYLYLPLRAAQEPLLNWGSPDTWADFWRHITVWQFRVYIGNQGNPITFLGPALAFAGEQLGPILGLVVLLLTEPGLLRLWRANRPLLIATALTALATLIYTLNYQIREVVVYYVPMYMMIILWAGIGLDWVARGLSTWLQAQVGIAPQEPAAPSQQAQLVALFPVLLGVLGLIWNAGRAGHPGDRLAEAYVRNQFKNFAPQAVVVTNNWDLVSPSYYLQYVLHERPDVAIFDKELLRYPFYLDYIDRQYPAVLAPAKAEETAYRAVERLWVDDQTSTAQGQLPTLYVNFVKSIITHSLDAGRPVYLQWTQPDPNNLPQEEAQISQDYLPNAYPEGLAIRIGARPFTDTDTLVDPQFDLTGILTNPVPKDEVAHSVIDFYPVALNRLATFARGTKTTDDDQKYSLLEAQVREALGLPPP